MSDLGPAAFKVSKITKEEFDKMGVEEDTCKAKIQQEIYIMGVLDGITRFAWWKDERQWVGTCGTTLEKAKEDVQKEILSHSVGWRI